MGGAGVTGGGEFGSASGGAGGLEGGEVGDGDVGAGGEGIQWRRGHS